MVRVSPNKRKSMGGEAVVTPKKAKTEVGPVKTPAKTPDKKTPKSVKKTPFKVENNDTPKKEVVKTPKAKTPKPNKFTGTNKLNVTNAKGSPAASGDDGSPGKKSKRQMRRKQAKLKKRAILENERSMKKDGNADKTAQDSVKEIVKVSNGAQSKKNKKAQSIINKTTKMNESENDGSTATKPKRKRNKKKGKGIKTNGDTVTVQKVNKNKPKKQETNDEEDESDYEVESMVKPEKVTKKLNQGSSDEEDEANSDIPAEQASDDDDNADDDDDDADAEPGVKVKQPKRTIDTKDLGRIGVLKKGQSRYVLFVNNLPYDATEEEITDHFKKTCEVKDVRIPKGTSQKPRGFAYVEVVDEESYQKALSLHHTFVDGRRINVQYTKGGEKNSPDRKMEIKKKNLKLQGMRQQGMLAGSKKDSQKRSVRRAKKRVYDAQDTKVAE